MSAARSCSLGTIRLTFLKCITAAFLLARTGKGYGTAASARGLDPDFAACMRLAQPSSRCKWISKRLPDYEPLIQPQQHPVALNAGIEGTSLAKSTKVSFKQPRAISLESALDATGVVFETIQRKQTVGVKGSVPLLMVLHTWLGMPAQTDLL